jgi:hypothetical protein
MLPVQRGSVAACPFGRMAYVYNVVFRVQQAPPHTKTAMTINCRPEETLARTVPDQVTKKMQLLRNLAEIT